MTKENPIKMNFDSCIDKSPKICIEMSIARPRMRPTLENDDFQKVSKIAQMMAFQEHANFRFHYPKLFGINQEICTVSVPKRDPTLSGYKSCEA